MTWFGGQGLAVVQADESMVVSADELATRLADPELVLPLGVDAEFVGAHLQTPGHAVVDARATAIYEGTQSGLYDGSFEDWSRRADLPVEAPAAAARPADEGFRADTRAYLARLEKLGFAGVLVVARDGTPIVAEGVGLADRERNTRWTPATVSTIGSITKQFTAAAILALEENGKLRVEDTLAAHFGNVPEDKRVITLHQLLSHSSGIVDPEQLGDFDPIGRAEYVRKVLAQPLVFQPGAGYEYSNANYSLLGAIVEQLTGRSWERFAHERLWLPQGMCETGYLLAGWGEGRLAQGYRRGQRWGTVLERPMAPDGPYWALRANGGVHATAFDMLRWAEALLKGQVLSAASMEKLWATRVKEPGDTVPAAGGRGPVARGGGRRPPHGRARRAARVRPAALLRGTGRREGGPLVRIGRRIRRCQPARRLRADAGAAA